MNMEGFSEPDTIISIKYHAGFLKVVLRMHRCDGWNPLEGSYRLHSCVKHLQKWDVMQELTYSWQLAMIINHTVGKSNNFTTT